MNILYIDTNLGLHMALQSAFRKAETYYAIATWEAYPRLESVISGWGFNNLLPAFHKTEDWGQAIEKADLVVFTDVGWGRVADWLRKEGWAVFGTDGKTQRLEEDRIYMKQKFRELGIKTASYVVLEGIEAVVDYIEANQREKHFIKVNKVRGNVETFGTDNPLEARVMLEQAGFSVLGESVEFIVEKELPGVEIGIDTFFNGKEFLGTVFDTIELKGSGNITIAKELEDSVWWEKVLKRIQSLLRANGYRGMIAFEGFYDPSTGELAVTDTTARFPYPCGYAYPSWIRNWNQVLDAVANGEYIDIELPEWAKASTQVGVYTDDIRTWRMIDIPPTQVLNNHAVRRAILKQGRLFYVPGDYLVVTALGYGEDRKAADVQATKAAEMVSMPNIYSQAYELQVYALKVAKKFGDLTYWGWKE